MPISNNKRYKRISNLFWVGSSLNKAEVIIAKQLKYVFDTDSEKKELNQILNKLRDVDSELNNLVNKISNRIRESYRQEAKNKYPSDRISQDQFISKKYHLEYSKAIKEAQKELELKN